MQQVKDLDSTLLVPVEIAEQGELLEHRIVEDLQQGCKLNKQMLNHAANNWKWFYALTLILILGMLTLS